MPFAERPPDRFSAWWLPSWYGTDPGLQVDRVSYHLLHRTPPAGAPGKWVFFPGLLNGREAEEGRVIHAHVESIRHKDLGAIRSVGIGSLVYMMDLADGRRIVVDSEERLGSSDSQFHIQDWTLEVELSRVPHPLYDLIEVAQDDPTRLSPENWDTLVSTTLDPDYVMAGIADQLVRRAQADPSRALLAAMRSEDETKQRAALDRLRQYRCDSPAVGSALLQVMRDQHGPIAFRAGQALAELRPQDAQSWIKEIGRWTPADRLTILRYLSRAKLTDRSLFELFFHDPDLEVRRLAQQILKQSAD